MTILLSGITSPVEEGPDGAVVRALTRLALPQGCVTLAQLSKVSVDARRHRVQFVCSVAVTLTEKGQRELSQRDRTGFTIMEPPTKLAPERGDSPLPERPVVIGFGPAGMFAALLLAQQGYQPIVIERGASMSKRVAAVDRFWNGGPLQPGANVQFGEGGAGTFSDGKLTTRIHDPLCAHILNELVRFGAPDDILIRAKPHIGTDRLRGVVTALREEIIRLGGEVRFDHAVRRIETKSGTLRAIETEDGMLPTRVAIVAVGHSARDTFCALSDCGVTLMPKAFSVGARIEHRQVEIDRALYGDGWAGHPKLPHGEYQLSHREGGRTLYTFCMCPGGHVVAAASEPGQVVTNGMSLYAREGENANSALVVSVGPQDFGNDWRDGIAFQRRMEEAAFVAGGGNFAAPFMTVGELMKTEKQGAAVTPSYSKGVKEFNLTEIFPRQIGDFMRSSLPLLGKKLRGFDSPNAILTGIETRTSSPLRMMRREDFCAEGIDGLYPCGEGAGYAGGIMSAAVDGIRCAMALMKRWGAPSSNTNQHENLAGNKPMSTVQTEMLVVKSAKK